jgi:sensor c-di-GMP phosphodiesterase-like protein
MECVRRLVLISCKVLSGAGVLVFMAGWAAAWFVHPPPDWLVPAMVIGIGIGMASSLLYHVANHSFTEPIERIDWEIETPTTVRNLVRQNPTGPAFILIALSVVAIALARARLRLSTAIPVGLLIGTVLSWVFVFLHARGWIKDE